MSYFLAFFAFITLFSAFIAAFIPLEFSLVFIFCLVLGCIGFLLFGKKYHRISALIASSAIGFGLVAANIFFGFYPALSLDGTSAEITGTVTEISAKGGNPVFKIKTDSVDIEGAPQKITVLVSGWNENFAKPYDKVSCNVTFSVYDSNDFGEVLENRAGKIKIYAYTNSPIEIIGKENSSFGFYINFIREKVSSVIYKFFPDWKAPFTEQILIGTRGELENEITEAFRKSGMSHILAVSGMHMAVIVNLFEKFFGLFPSDKNKRNARSGFIIVFIIFYMALCGLGMSVIRSGFMLIFHYLSKIFFSGSKPVENLGIAIVTVLLFDPFAACDSGFLMSVFSCGAIFIFAPHLKEFIVKHLKAEEKPLVKYFAEAFSVSTVAFLSVLPVSAAVFGKISLASPFSNLFAGFLTQYIIVFGLITVLIGFVPFLSFAAGGTAFIVSVFETLLLMIAKFFAGFSFLYADASESWFYIWILGSAVLIFVPIIVLKNLRFLKHSLLAAAFVLVFGILLNQIFFSGVAEIKISALEHGTAISCSKDENSVLITNGVSGSDVYNVDFPSSGFKTVISLNPSSDSAEYSIVDSAKPEKAFLSGEDSIERFDFSEKISEGEFYFSESDFVKIFPDSWAAFEINGIRVLYIFSKCDIMKIEPKFRRADIIILEGVSPEDFPVLRCDYLILREIGGYYSGTDEIITLKNGEINFFAFNGNLKKGSAAG